MAQEKPTNALKIRVHKLDGTLLTKAMVTVQGEKDDKPLALEPTNDGGLTTSISPGRYELTVSHRGLVTQTRTVIAAQGEDADETFILGTKNHEYYLSNGRLVPFEPRPDLLAVSPQTKKANNSAAEAIIERAQRLGLKQVDTKQAPHEALVFEFDGSPTNDERSAISRELEAMEEARHVGDVITIDEATVSFTTNEFLIRVGTDAKREEVAEKLRDQGWEISRWLPYGNGLAVARNRSLTGYEALRQTQAMMDDDSIQIIFEPNLVTTAVDDYTPDDFLLGSQPHLDIIGAEAAWDVTTGDPDIVIAVVDSGCDIDHPDFSAPGKVINPFDFESLDSDPEGSTHGTKSTGIATAVADNNEGVAGVAPGCRVMPIRRYTSGATDVEWADLYLWVGGFDPGSTTAGFPSQITPGADVITNSFGSYQTSIGAAVSAAFDTLTDDGRGGLGCVVVFSVGNDNQDFTAGSARQWAAYNRTIAVASSVISPPDASEIKVSTSNFGPAVDVCAPGGGPGGGTETRTLTTTDVGDGDTAGTAAATSNDYDDFGQTSCACPQVAGTAALILSARPDLTWTEVRDLLRSTATRIDTANTNATGQWVDNDGDGVDEFSQWYGFGRVNTEAAVCAAATNVELLTSDLHFLDIVAGQTAARAIRVRVQSCEAVTVGITSGPTLTAGEGTFGTELATNQVVTAPGGTDVFLWVTYTNPDANESAEGTVTVTVDGVSTVIPILANTIPRPTAAIALALDQSGSMGWASGFASPLDSREDVLKFSALPVADFLGDDDQVGMVTFDHDGHPLMPMEVAGPLMGGMGRANARSAVMAYAHNPSGGTAIGDGVEWAHDLVDPVVDVDVKATVVLTDGHETSGKYITEVSSIINERVYGIGMGNADTIEPTALTALTNSTGGFTLLTGDAGPNDEFLLAKYYLQVLAGIHNADIVLDPEGTLAFGSHHKIPFYLNERDIESDVILLTALPSAVQFVLESPSGEIITPATPGAEFSISAASAMYRLGLPVGTNADHGGQWIAHLLLDKKQTKLFSETHGHRRDNSLGRGLRYSLNVQAWSDVQLRARLHQTSQVPGAQMTVRARLTEIGIPISRRAKVVAHITRPDRSDLVVDVDQVEPGTYAYSWTAQQSGVYRVRLVAEGFTQRGARFTREHLLTGQTWRTGNEPAPTGPGGTTGHDDWSEVLCCIAKALTPTAWKRLEGLGVDTERLRRCLDKICRGDTTTVSNPDLQVGELTELLRDVLRVSPVRLSADAG